VVAQFIQSFVAGVLDSSGASLKSIKKQLETWEKAVLLHASRLPLLLDLIQKGLGIKSRGMVVVFMEPRGVDGASLRVSFTANAKPVADLLRQGDSVVGAGFIKEFRGARAPPLTLSPTAGSPEAIAAFLVECCGPSPETSTDTRHAIMALLSTLTPTPHILQPSQCCRPIYPIFSSFSLEFLSPTPKP
jgi:hypothetical protein